MSKQTRTIIWIAMGVAIAAAYLWAANTQQVALNLSATAGGQYPYLMNAKRMAEEGVFAYMGDRNRTPLYPALLSLVYTPDWDAFVARAARFAVVTSLLFIGIVAALAGRLLPRWGVVFTVLITAFLLFMDRASFVQAELLFYTLFLASWLCMCRVLVSPKPGLAAVAGILGALAYLAKASALPLMALFLLANFLAAAARLLRWRSRKSPPTSNKYKEPGRHLLAGGIAAAVFVLVASLYLVDNYRKFGRPFYNVNSKFFMWCDSWQEAKRFADRYEISQRFPDAPPQSTPSWRRYIREHSTAQIVTREIAGLRSLLAQCVRDPAFRYIALMLLAAIVFTIAGTTRGHNPPLHASAFAFTVATIALYLLGYAWYAQIAFGVRFVRSLYLPVLFVALYWIQLRIPGGAGNGSRASRRAGTLAIFVLLPFLATESAIQAICAARPDPTFVNFYFNEAQERLNAQDLGEAKVGMLGVLRLDPDFAPALRALGYIHLREADFESAAKLLRRAVKIDPDNADGFNSLGSALVQLGDLQSAAGAFETATTLDNAHAVAWFNLATVYIQLGRVDHARPILALLERLEPRLARQLADRLQG